MSAHTYDDVWLDRATHPSHLYHHRGIATGVSSFDDITDKHLTAFDRQGYLVVQNALDALLFLTSGGNPAFRGIQFEKTAQGIPIDELPAEKNRITCASLCVSQSTMGDYGLWRNTLN